MAKKTVEKTDKSIMQQAKDCLEKFQDRESDNIRRAQDAILFRSGEQWPEQIQRDREDEHQEGGSRPCPVLDKTDQYVRQIVNEERLNRAAIKIRPVDDGADPKTAEIITGIIRHIEDASEATVAYSSAGEQAIDGGFGYFRILSEYENDKSFDQEIKIKRIHNRFSVALGPHTESDASDVKEAVIWEDMPRDDFKREYPKAKEISFDANDDSWSDENTIKIAEYFKIVPNLVTIHLMDNGDVVTDEEYKSLKSQGLEPPEPIDTRETDLIKVKWYKITSEEILEEQDLLGSYIPVIKVTGNEITLPDGKIRLSGAIESAMDAQRLHNYAHAGFIEHVALAPRAPWVAAAEQIESYETEYSEANRKPIAVLKYDPIAGDNGIPLPPPQRTPPPGMSTGWQQIMQNTEHGVEASFGMYGPSVGAASQEKSGVALQEQKQQGAVGQFHFPDNLARSIQHCGRILLEWIPGIYDAATVARILGEDGEQEEIKLNPEQEESIMPEMDEFEQEVGKIYNLGVGRYDVTVSTGPSYTAKRQEAVDTQTQIIQAAPDLMPIIGDILFSNMDAPGSDKIADRLKTMLPPEIQQLEQDKNIDPQTQAAMAQIDKAAQEIEMRGQQLAEMEQEIKAQGQEVTADKAEIQSAIKALDSQKKVFMADAKTVQANLELLGVKLINQLEDVTEPLTQQLANQTAEVETGEHDEEGKPETIVVQDPAMQQILQDIAAMTNNATEQMAQTVNDALITISTAVNAPRRSELQYDEAGNPIGSVSTPL